MDKSGMIGPELEPDGSRLASKIKKMGLAEIQSRIPKIMYAGILLSADILYNDHLRGRDPKKRKEAAAVFLDRLGSANFIKNIQSLGAGKKEEDAKKPTSADWENK